MGHEIWLLTEKGLVSPDGRLHPELPFGGSPVSAGVAAGDSVALVVSEHEVWTRTRGVWNKAASSGVELYCVARQLDGRFLVGAENARLGRVEEGALEFIESFDAVPERRLWDTPYGAPPELRSLAVATDGTIYANVHVGWVVRSTDNGKTWRSLRTGLDRDVHQVATHPSDPKTVFAATSLGFHVSRDQGETFERHTKGMPYYYQRATACFPGRDIYLVSIAKHDGGAGARLYRSEDGGREWTRVRGLPEKIDRNINTSQLVALPEGRAFVVVDDTSLYETTDWGESWHPLVDGLPSVNAVLAI